MKTIPTVSRERVEREISSLYNPLLFLNPRSLRRMLDEFMRGELSHAARLFDMIYRRDDLIRCVADKRHGDISKLDWHIVPCGEDEAESQRHGEVLQRFYDSLEFAHAVELDKRGCISMLVDHMMTAVDNKYSVHEIVFRPHGGELRAQLRFVPLWFFEAKTGKLRFLESTNGGNGVEMKPWEWLVCVSKGALMEPSCMLYLAKNGGWKNWLVYADRFGFPLLDATTKAQPGSGEWNEFFASLQNFRNGYAMLHDSDSTLNLLQAGGAGAPFQAIVQSADRALAALWRGSDLSTLSNANATGASMQGDEKTSLENSDARMIEETLEHGLSLRVLQYYFGEDVVPAAKFALQRTDSTNAKEYLDVVERLSRLGIRLGKRTVRQACRMPDSADDEELVDVPQMSAMPAGFENESDDIAELSRAMTGEKKQKFLAELDRIDAMTDVSQRADALVALEKNLGEFFDGGDAEATAIFDILKRRLTNEK